MIIISGCSWSDPNWRCESDINFDTTFPKWYELLETDKDIKSIAKSGSGNQTQIELLVNEIKTNNKVVKILYLSQKNKPTTITKRRFIRRSKTSRKKTR